jgi:hypothetical protein
MFYGAFVPPFRTFEFRSELLEYLGGRGKSRASIEDMELLKDAPVGSNSGNGIFIWKSPRSSCFLSSSKTT